MNVVTYEVYRVTKQGLVELYSCASLARAKGKARFYAATGERVILVRLHLELMREYPPAESAQSEEKDQ